MIAVSISHHGEMSANLMIALGGARTIMTVRMRDERDDGKRNVGSAIAATAKIGIDRARTINIATKIGSDDIVMMTKITQVVRRSLIRIDLIVTGVEFYHGRYDKNKYCTV
jgi:hypothetical protein